MIALFTDYDRTITNSQLELCNEVIDEIMRLRRSQRLKFIVASGRTLEFLQGRLSGYADGIVAENGAIIYYDGKKEVFGKEESEQIKGALLKLKDLIYFGEIIAYALKDAEPQIVNALRLKNVNYAIEKNKNSIMIMPKFINKGFGILKIAERMGLSNAKKIAIGDDENDISMFRAVDLPVAIGNSDSRLRAISKAFVEKEYCDGVLEFLKQINMNNFV